MRSLKISDLEPNMTDFASNALDGKYILIVGSSAVIKKEKYGGDGVKMLLDKALEAEYRDNTIMLETMRRDCPSFTEWEVPNTMFDNVRNAYCECKSYNLSEIVEPTLRELMKTRLFRIVLTTTLDPIIEKLMDSIWGKGNYDIICGPDDDSIRGEKLDQYKNIINRERPLLCYVLGRIQEGTTNRDPRYTFALTESDALNMMAKWIINSTEGNSFMSSVRKKECLHVSIGCKFDDWMFRFFWYLVTGEAGKDKEIGQVVVDLEHGLAPNPENSSLSRHLKREKTSVSFENSREFMKKAVDAIKAEKKSRLAACKKHLQEQGLFVGNKPSIFLSYAHEDYSYVRRLYKKILDEKRFDVWMDEYELEPGDDIKVKIETAIRDRCRYFVPILSSVVWDILNDKKKGNRWVLNEWKMAQNTLGQIEKDKKGKPDNDEREFDIIPVVTYDFLEKEKKQVKYRSFVQKCFMKKKTQDGTLDYPEIHHCEGISDFVDFIKERNG